MSAQRAKTLHISAAFTRIKQYTCTKHVRKEQPSAFLQGSAQKTRPNETECKTGYKYE